MRLIGVGVGELSVRSQQLSLWETADEREHRLATALDEIRSRFGVHSVHKGAAAQGATPTRYRPFGRTVGETRAR
ncbi:MAG: hypothetical protein HY675_02590 [Chloroflexi bacterium]|nr:hypothetical protein [Chloroflexota bacterium]